MIGSTAKERKASPSLLLGLLPTWRPCNTVLCQSWTHVTGVLVALPEMLEMLCLCRSQQTGLNDSLEGEQDREGSTAKKDTKKKKSKKEKKPVAKAPSGPSNAAEAEKIRDIMGTLLSPFTCLLLSSK